MQARTRAQPDNLTVIDLYVGANIRIRRKELGLSQIQLAEAVGVSFQQLQKYERGTNRVSSSTLFVMSKVLKVPIQFFFSGLGDQADGIGPASAGVGDLLSENGSLQLLSSYRMLTPPMRRALVAITGALVVDDADPTLSLKVVSRERLDTNLRRVRQNNAS